MKDSCMQRGSDLFERASVCLAPLAGYTDAPFRLLCSEFGADFTVTEMVNADGLVRGSLDSNRLLEKIDGEGPLGVQLFGSDPATIADAAAMIEVSEPAFVDLNFGCPVRKVVKRGSGAALMRDLPLMERICREVVKRVSVPVTAKIRSGWSRDEENYLQAGKILEDSGVSTVTIHPRYRSQRFRGAANWEHIARLKETLTIPVIANGDVMGIDDYDEIVRVTGCRIIMIGRGALGRPWIFREIKNRNLGMEPRKVDLDECFDILERHVRMEIEWKGERLGVLEMRKVYRWYLRGFIGAKAYRCRLSRAETPPEIFEILHDLREEHTTTWKKPA